MVCAGAAAGTLIGSWAFLSTASVQATTGNPEGLPAPKVKVDPAIGDLYVGRFYLSRVERRAGLISAVLDVNYTESVISNFLIGIAEFHQYDKSGRPTAWTASMYPFEYRNGRMYCKLLEPGTTDQVLGRLVLEKPAGLDTPEHPNQETVGGRLTIGGSTYNVGFRQAESSGPPPAQLPRAEQTGPGTPLRPGAAAPAGATAGLYTSVVRYAEALG